MSLAYINIGSNLGDRYQLIQTALAGISALYGICCISSYIETEPWGFESDNRFLNLGVSFKTTDSPEELLQKLKGLEKTIGKENHRHSDGRYKDRDIDIDIMAIDEMTYKSETLTIPHPHLLERDFFLKPMKELNPGWRHP